MSLIYLSINDPFPPATFATEDGLLAIGADLSTDRLLKAYSRGIFPWFDDATPLWWCPDPRFVLFPQHLNISTSMKQVIKRKSFQFSSNTAFEAVIHHCKSIDRPDQDGTWITTEVEKAYIQLHQLGIAHSAECWENGVLVGGLYGIKMGKVFFGESMFSHTTNASKFAFIQFVQQLMAEDIQLIDCQVYTKHLESLGAKMIPRIQFLDLLKLCGVHPL